MKIILLLVCLALASAKFYSPASKSTEISPMTGALEDWVINYAEGIIDGATFNISAGQSKCLTELQDSKEIMIEIITSIKEILHGKPDFPVFLALITKIEHWLVSFSKDCQFATLWKSLAILHNPINLVIKIIEIASTKMPGLWENTKFGFEALTHWDGLDLGYTLGKYVSLILDWYVY